MRVFNRAVLAAALATAVLQASCGSEDPARVDRPPVVESFQPTSRHIDAFVGDTLRFSINASDPDRDQLATVFFIDDSRVAEGDYFDFAIVDAGLVKIHGTVTDGSHTSYISWEVKSEVPINFPPIIETTLPVELNPTLVIGTYMDFAVIARDPELLPLSYSFSVNDSLVVNDRQFRYLGSSVGLKKVRAVVSDGEKAVAHEWQLKVTTVPDNIPPAPVVITLAETGAEPGEINIEWTAVGRDGMVGKPSLYMVRTSPAPILTEQDWARSSERPDVPAPATAGETMGMVVGDLLPARPTYVAVRAIDDFGNISAIQQPAVQTITRGMRFGGRVVDTITYQGIPNVTVAFGNEAKVTDSEGVYEFTEQGFGQGIIYARDENGEGIGSYYNYDLPYSVAHLDVVNLYLLPNYDLTTTRYADFLQFYRKMTDVEFIPYSADTRRRQPPIALYCRPFSKNGLDYAETIRSVSEEFVDIVGFPLFYPAPDPLPEARVETTYNGIITRDRYSVMDWSQDYYPLAGLIEFRVHYQPSSVEPFKEIIRHELGHALGLNHSLDTAHLMIGFQAASVSTFTPDEVAVLRSYYCVPRGWNARLYQRD